MTQPLNRRQMAWRAAQDIGDGLLVNLGMGMPVHVADYLRPEVDVFIQAENGVIGAGPLAGPERADPDLVDASSRRITLRPGASIINSSWSFAMIRGGHIDITILGAFEVAANGDLANWDMRVPDKGPLVGGAMDLAACAQRSVGHHGAPHAQGRPPPDRGLHAAADGDALRDARLHRPRRGRCHPGRLRRARHPRWHDAGAAARAHRRSADVCAGLPGAGASAAAGCGVGGLAEGTRWVRT